jgi:hypothetical protein
MPFVQRYVTGVVERELSGMLGGAPVRIGRAEVSWINRIVVRDLRIDDRKGENILTAGNVTAGFRLLPALRDKWIVTTVRLFGLSFHVRRDTPGGETNLQFIIDALQKNSAAAGRTIELEIRSVLVRRGTFTYDVRSVDNSRRHFNPDHLSLRNISGKLSLEHYSRDSIRAHIGRLSFDEVSGLSVSRLSAAVTVTQDTAFVEQFLLRMPHSLIDVLSAGISLEGGTGGGWRAASLARSRIAATVAPSSLAPEDFAAFLPALQASTDRIDFAARVSGTVDDLSMDELEVRCGEDASLSAAVALRGLTGGGAEPYLLGRVKRLTVTAGGLRRISGEVGRELELPGPVMRLGVMEFGGEISGFMNHLVAFGTLSSPVAGAVRVDLLAGGARDSAVYVRGHVASAGLRLGSLFEAGNPYGTARFSADVDLTKRAGKKASGTVKAQVEEFAYRGYAYRNIQASGRFRADEYEGAVRMNDPCGTVDVRGLYRGGAAAPLLDITAHVRRLRPDRLHLTDACANPELSFAFRANFTGDNADDFEGYAGLDSLSFSTDDGRFFLRSLRLEASAGQSSVRRARILSDIVNGEITGRYSFSSLVSDLLHTSERYLPSLSRAARAHLAAPSPSRGGENRFDFLFTVENTDTLSRLLHLPLAVLRPSTFRGQYGSEAGVLHADARLPLLRLGTTVLDSVQLHLDNAGEALHASLTASQNYRGSTHNHLRLAATARDDSLSARLFWTNDRESRFDAALSATALFVEEEGTSRLRTEITIPPAQLTLKDSLWRLDPASVTISGGRVMVDNFYLTGRGGQYLHLNGSISRDPQDALHVDLNGIELSHIFDMLNIPSLQFGGRATGAFAVRDPYAALRIDGRLEVLDFAFNRAVQGRLNLSSQWDSDRQGILLLGSIYRSDSVWTDVNGYIIPAGDQRGLSLYFDANDLNLAFLQKYLRAFAGDVSGRIFGNVHLYGTFSHIYLAGTPRVRDASLRLNLLNTTCTFSDTVFLDRTSIRLRDILLADAEGNTGQLSLDLTHDHFDDLHYSLNIKTRNMLLYDIPASDNPTIHGHVYASGTADISGTEDIIYVGGNLRTEAGTSAGFNFTENATAASYDFITFVEKPSDTVPAPDIAPSFPSAPSPSMDYQLNLLLNVTPDAALELTLSSAPDDKIRGSGSGDIQIRYGSQSDLQIFGNYLISEGTYNFNLQQLIRKRFNIRDGSIITFRGDPMAANLAISAAYSLTANIQDLDETFLMETANPSIPVNCILQLDGRLQNPAITFDLELPSSNSEMARQVKSFIDTEDMMTRQIIYLLVLNKFYTPDYSRNDYRSNEFSAVASSALSAQLSGILSSLTDKVQIGTNIRSRQDGIRDTEVEMLLSSQLLNNRLLFNGNFGYKDNTVMTNTFVGEFDLEYKLMRNREISLKAYNHANDLYRYNAKSLTRQGVGIMIRKDFSSLRDLFAGRKKKEESDNPED